MITIAKAVYPNGVLAWTPRIDEVNVVYAADPNTLAVELQAVESTIGTNPQNEASPPAGSTVAYSTMSSRVSAAMNNVLSPCVSLLNNGGFFINQGQQAFNRYTTQEYDPYNIWNGTDLTIPCNGWWSIRADQKWNQHGNNFHGLNVFFLYLNGTWIDMELWDWSTAIAADQYNYPANILGSNGWTKLSWMGMLHKGDRIQLLSANATYCPGIQITNMTMKAYCHRTVSTAFVSG